MPSLTSAPSVTEFPNTLAATVSDFVAGLQRINARRAPARAASAKAAQEHRAAAGRSEISLPSLSAGFGDFAWRS
ncbi:MAG: hypothetical protein V4693_05415 [Pseudomonadota bacterium]